MSDGWKELPTLKDVARAIDEEMEIEVFTSAWFPWSGMAWNSNMSFRARPRKPVAKKVKSLCYRDSVYGDLFWRIEECIPVGNTQRFPAGDIEGEVEA